MSEPRFNPVTTAAVREARRSVAALLLQIPEEVWREHKGVFENAVAGLVEDCLALEADHDRLRAALGTVLVAMVEPGLLATDVDLEQVVRAALAPATERTT